MTDETPNRSGSVGGQDGLPDQLLDDGQEEVFSREEVESGRIEHQAGQDRQPPPLGERPERLDQDS